MSTTFTKDQWEKHGDMYLLTIAHATTKLPKPLTFYDVIIHDGSPHPAEVEFKLRAHELVLEVFTDPDLRFDGSVDFVAKKER